MTSQHRRFLLPALLCAVLAGLFFLPGLPGGFVFDDNPNIIANSAVHLQSLNPGALTDAAFNGQPSGPTRVIPALTFALDYWRGGLDPAVFKTTNIAIHALTAFALAWLFRALLLIAGITAGRARLTAVALALAWALHPLQVSSVLYAVQRIQTLATLSLVLALLAYLHARKAQIDGQPGRSGWLLTGLLWGVAFACKEDALLLPAYTLALELTVLRFAASDTHLAQRIRKGYVLATLAGTATYLLLVVPHFWSWDAYPGRDFSSWERLLTQGRVLCMYLGEILLPLPNRMPFYYDWLQPSRGLLQPWTTLPSILLLAALLSIAWRLRTRRPLFALGVFLFFFGHFITSNVIGLELAFEHRNSFPLIGVVLAVADMLIVAGERLQIRPSVATGSCLLLLALLASATVVRAVSWDSRMRLARTGIQLAPESLRAWNDLCVTYFDLGGGARADNPHLNKAISACDKAASIGTDSLPSMSNIIVFKATQGSLTPADWNRYLERLRHVTMTPENRAAIWPVLNTVRNGALLDESHIFAVLDIVSHRAVLSPVESAAIGYFIVSHTHQPERAYPFFAHVVQTTSDPSFAQGIIDELRKDGRIELAEKLQALAKSSSNSTAPHHASKDHPR